MSLKKQALKVLLTHLNIREAIELIIIIEPKSAPFSDGQIWEILSTCLKTTTSEEIMKIRTEISIPSWPSRLKLKDDNERPNNLSDTYLEEITKIVCSESKFNVISDEDLTVELLAIPEDINYIYSEDSDTFSAEKHREYLSIPGKHERSIESILNTDIYLYTLPTHIIKTILRSAWLHCRKR